MAITTGTQAYQVDSTPVIARGATYTAQELDDALADPVSGILSDTTGNIDLQSILTSLITTEFSEQSVNRILTAGPHVLEDWRVGEGFAEAFLNTHRNCSFPWPSGRDLKNPNSSPAGTDLVGFQRTDTPVQSHRFAFGEVKTSAQAAWPPSVVYGRHGLQAQIEGLKTSSSVKDLLVKYLGHHAPGTSWFPNFQSAASRYLANTEDVSLFGILIRDVDPRQQDLENRAQDLATNCPGLTSIELRAMYFPIGQISSFGQRARTNGPSNSGGLNNALN